METAQRLRTVMAAHRLDAAVATSTSSTVSASPSRPTQQPVPPDDRRRAAGGSPGPARGHMGWITDIRAYNEFTDDPRQVGVQSRDESCRYLAK
jgi:hypothetical protein